MITRHLRAFTLIEMLVVVALIALVISILLPALQSAREQAKIAACLSNISQVGRVLNTYILDHGEPPVFTLGGEGWCVWAYGGWSGKNRAEWEDQWYRFNIQTADRPLTAYATKGPIAAEIDRFATEEAKSYRCPSDRRSAQWQWGQSDDATSEAISAYDDVGTSYALNWSWWNQTEEGLYPPGTDPSGEWSWSFRAEVIGHQLWSRMYIQQASRFLTLYEDPMDYGLNVGTGEAGSGIQTMGFHGRFSKHAGFFADGHGEYRLFDTRHHHDWIMRHGEHAVCGHWTTLDEHMEHVAGLKHY